MQKRIYVTDIRPGDQVVDYFRVLEARLAPYRDEAKGHYLHLVLADRSGQIRARLWEGAEEAARWLTTGQIVQVRARAALYQDHIRLRLDSLEPAGEDSPPLRELLPAPPVDVAEALADVHAAIGRVTNAPLRTLLESLFGDSDFVEAFSAAPADRPGELLARTVQLLELAGPLARLGSQLDLDLLQAGVLLHGIGETIGLDSITGARAMTWLGVATLSNQLIGERLAQAPDFPADLALDLRHLILAATGQTAPRSQEAAVLARLRDLQAELWRWA